MAMISKWSGMTTNERLVESGMMDKFDACVRLDQKAPAKAILKSLGLSEHDAEISYNIARRDPAVMQSR